LPFQKQSYRIFLYIWCEVDEWSCETTMRPNPTPRAAVRPATSQSRCPSLSAASSPPAASSCRHQCLPGPCIACGSFES
jgi:hypothetical protein